MKRSSRSASFIKPFVFGWLLVLWASAPALAAEAAQGWRPIYDLVMEWLNFAILFFVIYKYGRRPLLDFLRGQKNEIEKELSRIEGQKDEALAKVREAAEALEQSKVRLPELKARLIEQGERKKQELIDEAREQSRLIMAGGLQRIEYQIIRAKHKLSLELLDMAVDEAIRELPGIITAEDNRLQVEKFMAIAESP